jgi:hypothetical protein
MFMQKNYVSATLSSTYAGSDPKNALTVGASIQFNATKSTASTTNSETQSFYTV